MYFVVVINFNNKIDFKAKLNDKTKMFFEIYEFIFQYGIVIASNGLSILFCGSWCWIDWIRTKKKTNSVQ